jgi:hypothetical protein
LKHTNLALGALLLLTPAGAAFAATVSTAAKPAHRTAHIVYPARDMTTAEVRARFGAPEHKLAPDPPTSQGPLKPPIERWIYPHFIVYFEHHRVIHTVLTHPHPAPMLTHRPGGDY